MILSLTDLAKTIDFVGALIDWDTNNEQAHTHSTCNMGSQVLSVSHVGNEASLELSQDLHACFCRFWKANAIKPANHLVTRHLVDKIINHIAAPVVWHAGFS